jgi:hypothetical protein
MLAIGEVRGEVTGGHGTSKTHKIRKTLDLSRKLTPCEA